MNSCLKSPDFTTIKLKYSQILSVVKQAAGRLFACSCLTADSHCILFSNESAENNAQRFCRSELVWKYISGLICLTIFFSKMYQHMDKKITTITKRITLFVFHVILHLGICDCHQKLYVLIYIFFLVQLFKK